MQANNSPVTQTEMTHMIRGYFPQTEDCLTTMQ